MVIVDDKVKMGSGSSIPYYAGLQLHVLSFGYRFLHLIID